MIDKLMEINVNIRVFIMLVLAIICIYFTFTFPEPFQWLFLLLMFIIIGLHIYVVAISEKRHINSVHDYNMNFIKNSNVNYDDFIFSDDGGGCIAISEKDSRVYIFKRTNLQEDYQMEEFNFSQIVESGIIEDGQTITKTSKSGLIGGSLLGGVFGGFGAVVGALGADKTSVERVNKLSLSIVVDDLMNPVHDIVFLTTVSPITKDDQSYIINFHKCNMWHKRMSVIIKRNEK